MKKAASSKKGERKTKTGFAAKLYQLTTRAYLAILLNRIHLESFIEKASEAPIISALATFTVAIFKQT